MRKEKSIMGMIVVVDIADDKIQDDIQGVQDNTYGKIFEEVFSYFSYVEEKFSLFRPDSEICRINRGEIATENFSDDMKEVFRLSEETRLKSNGYFDIKDLDGKYNTSGMVKGWAIYNASKILKRAGYKNFIVEAGGDIEACGKNSLGELWHVGISSPFKPGKEIVKVLEVEDRGVATSGTYAKGNHIYNPLSGDEVQNHADGHALVSLTVIGPNIYEADRFATAAFAMGDKGIEFIESLSGFEGYSINKDGIATMTSNFDKYVSKK